MKLKIERPTREPSEGWHSCERRVLEAAVRALSEVQDNVKGLALLPPPESAQALRKKAQELAQMAMKNDALTSESPEGALHHEHSGWGLPISEAPAIPRELLAADVLDFLASVLGSGDRIVVSEEGN